MVSVTSLDWRSLETPKSRIFQHRLPSSPSRSAWKRFARLQITVNDPSVVRDAEPFANLHHERGGIAQRERAARTHERHGILAAESLHGDVGERSLLAPHVIDGDDVR